MVKTHKQRFSVLFFCWSSFMVFMYYFSLLDGKTLILNYDFISVSSTYLTFSFLFDKISLSFSALVCYISGCVFMFARWYMKDDVFYQRFIWILVSFVLSMNMLIFSGSLMALLIGWDGLGVSSFALIIYYESKESLRAGFLTLLVNRIGDVLIMSTMYYLILSGSLLYYGLTESASYTMLLLLTIAALTKSAQYPFSSWLPAAMAAPTPVSALVHSSTLVTAGVYILIRAFMVFNISNEISNILLFCGALTSLVGGLCAMYENDLKKIIAFSTLSQLGVMMFSLGLGSPTLALLHLYMHAMFKAMLFLVAGCVLLVTFGIQDIRLLGGVLKNFPILLVFLNTSALCLMGTPFLSAYYSKHSILNLMLTCSTNFLPVFMMLIATVLSSVYMLRLLKTINWGSSFTPIVSPTSTPIYYPVFLLWCGAVFLGWMFSKIEPEYLLSSSLPSYMNKMTNSLMCVGILMGLLMPKLSSSRLVATMLYMDPLWGHGNIISNKIMLNVKKLENGWIEPHTYLSSINKFVMSYMVKSNWPTTSFNFINFSVVLIIVFYVVG